MYRKNVSCTVWRRHQRKELDKDTRTSDEPLSFAKLPQVMDMSRLCSPAF
jgi:hypothetical protein